MNEDWELWGTFSVKDHLRPRAFVGDVLLYDKLVIPTPPTGNAEEFKRWIINGWQPVRQQRLLDLFDKKQLVLVPWNEYHRRNYEEIFDQASAGIEQRTRYRQEIAQQTHADVELIQMERREHHQQQGKTFDAEFDTKEYMITRSWLRDWSNAINNNNLIRSVPGVDVSVIPAYGSYVTFQRENNVRTVQPHLMAEAELLGAFGWKFFVPDDTTIPPRELLRRAIELANREETKVYRKAFHYWRRSIILGLSTPGEAAKFMEDAMAEYEAAVKTSKFQMRQRWAYAIMEATADLAAYLNPLIKLVMPAFKLADKVRADVSTSKLPVRFYHAAMFHDARKRFEWK